MKVFSIRVPEKVHKKLKSLDVEYMRERLTEIAGFTYSEEKRLIMIEEIVKKLIKENIGPINKETNKPDTDLTDMAMDTILNMIQ